MTNRRERRRTTKTNKIESRHFRTDIKVALAGDQYRELNNTDMTDEEWDMSIKLFHALKDRVSPDNGLTMRDLISAVLGVDMEYTKEFVYKIKRVLQWMKKSVLNSMVKSKEDDRFNFMVCKIGDLYFNGTDLKYVKQTFEYHGLHASKASGVFLTKGGGMLPVFDEDNNDLPPEECDDSIQPEDLDKEGNVISENIKGNYTTEQGLDELGYLMTGVGDLLYKLKDGESINDIELTDKLFPEAKITKLKEKDIEVFKYYHTKVLDALYAKTGDPMYLRHKVEKGLFELYGKKPSPKDLEDNLKKELINNKFGDRYNTNEKMDELYDLADKLIGIFDEEKETSLEDHIHKLFPETKNMYYGHKMNGDYNPELDPYFDKVKDACYLIKVHSNTFKQNKKLQEKQMNLKQKTGK